jgi:hypothetical protein
MLLHVPAVRSDRRGCHGIADRRCDANTVSTVKKQDYQDIVIHRFYIYTFVRLPAPVGAQHFDLLNAFLG